MYRRRDEVLTDLYVALHQTITGVTERNLYKKLVPGQTVRGACVGTAMAP